MNALIETVKSGGTIAQALFLMVVGMSFVFVVQVIFFVVIKAWPKGKKEA